MVGDNNKRNTEDTNSKIGKLISLFNRTNEAEVRNSKILASFNGDLGAEIVAQKFSPLEYGSEFCNTSELTKLFYYHEDNINIISIIQQGSRYHLDEIEEETGKSDLYAMIIRGKQKSHHSEINLAYYYTS